MTTEKQPELENLKNKKCRTCRTKCKFVGMRDVYGRGYDQDGNDIDELFVAYLQD